MTRFGKIRRAVRLLGLVLAWSACSGRAQLAYEQIRSFGFTNLMGHFLQANLVEGSDGALYGTTDAGGDAGFGTVFRLQPAPDLSLERTPTGPRLRFAGEHGRTYEVQRATVVTGLWDTIATRLAPPDNIVQYTDSAPPGATAIYRVYRAP